MCNFKNNIPSYAICFISDKNGMDDMFVFACSIEVFQKLMLKALDSSAYYCNTTSTVIAAAAAAVHLLTDIHFHTSIQNNLIYSTSVHSLRKFKEIPKYKTMSKLK
jgi:hypothetical protein